MLQKPTTLLQLLCLSTLLTGCGSSAKVIGACEPVVKTETKWLYTRIDPALLDFQPTTQVPGPGFDQRSFGDMALQMAEDLGNCAVKLDKIKDLDAATKAKQAELNQQ